MRKMLLCLLYICCCQFVTGQQQYVEGYIYDADTKSPLPSCRVRYIRSGGVSVTDENGRFRIPYTFPDSLEISRIGYGTVHYFAAGPTEEIRVGLSFESTQLEEVRVNTGYFRLSKERATGAFAHADNRLLNRSISPNVLDRLENILPGLQFVNSNGTQGADIRVRGLSTIESDETPLVVLDNFPYEGNLANIDPNTIENVTVLKDAAAASIWGAKAGNGVIVLTSKKGMKNRSTVEFTSNFGIAEKVDLGYQKNWLESEAVMAIEKNRFVQNGYSFGNDQNISLYVDLLNRQQQGLVSQEQFDFFEERLKGADLRDQAMRYLYQTEKYWSTSVQLGSSGTKYSYFVTAGHLRNLGKVIGNSDIRNNLSFKNRFVPSLHWDVGAGIDYVGIQGKSDGISLEELSQGRILSPYWMLKDAASGDNLWIPRVNLLPYYAEKAESIGLRDWLYRPLDERELSDKKSFEQEIRINADLNLHPLEGLQVQFLYQYVYGNQRSQNHMKKESYYVRDLVNMFTQDDGLSVVPYNDIFETGNPVSRSSHYGRGQVNYSKEWKERNELTVIGGMEVRHAQQEQFPATRLYNYEGDYYTGTNLLNYNQNYTTLPSGKGQKIPAPSSIRSLFVNRDISYYANGSYILDSRYTFSGSIRWDGSNLFGVKTNQKGVPLWSLGGSWNWSKEEFYPLRTFIPYWRWRFTYGVAGNVNKSISHYPTMRLSPSAFTGKTVGTLLSIGNPGLRWERVNTLNIGMDWKMWDGRIEGNLDHYVKAGDDLIGDDYMDPTTGISTDYKVNYADIRTKGWDLQLTTHNIRKAFVWKSVWTSSWVSNKVTNYRTNDDVPIAYYFYNIAPPVVGRSRDAMYALEWNGLSEDGLPLAYIDGQPSLQYNTYLQNHVNYTDLKYVGKSVPSWYGSVRNSLSWKSFDLSFMISWKSGYVFRRSSMRPTDEYSDKYHMDYYKRWKKPGDEHYTNVPRGASISESKDLAGIESVYGNAEILIEKGDHIRWQDFQVGYTLPYKTAFRSVRFNAYVKNLGIIWRANKEHIDPDVADSWYTEPISFRFALQIGL